MDLNNSGKMTLKCSQIFNELCSGRVEPNENEIVMKAETEDGPLFTVSDGCRNPVSVLPPVVRNLCEQALCLSNLVIFLEQVGGF